MTHGARRRGRRLNVDEYSNPLSPLLSKIAEEFIDDQDLSARLQRLFKVRSLLTLPQRHAAPGSFCL